MARNDRRWQTQVVRPFLSTRLPVLYHWKIRRIMGEEREQGFRSLDFISAVSVEQHPVTLETRCLSHYLDIDTSIFSLKESLEGCPPGGTAPLSVVLL